MKCLAKHQLRRYLAELHGKRYSAYKKLKSIVIDYGVAKAIFTRIQGDPHAPPSIMEITIPSSIHGFPQEFLKDKSVVAFTDYIARVLYNVTRRHSRKCGSGYSCFIGIPKPSSRILLRSCVEVGVDNSIILRLYIGLPAKGRRILGDKAKTLLLEVVPEVIKSILKLQSGVDEIKRHIQNYLDQEYLRQWLYREDYLFFIADNSILPRESSLSDKPMANAVPFKSPKTLKVQVRLPSGRVVTGMAVPKGLIVVTGGGYHGKTTLLEAIQEGIYNHVEGDGRELVVSRKYTVIVRAEDGRIVSHVDISSFIGELPIGKDTSDFTSLDSSGSTSMAASISEAIEAGAELLLIDEDTSATNLLYKDNTMSKIIRKEPIKPLSLQIKDIIRKANLGVVVITSASSTFINHADKVILMENYLPIDITEHVKSQRDSELQKTLHYKLPRKRLFYGIKGLEKVRVRGFKITTKYSDGTIFELDLTYYPRVVEKGQVKFIAHVIEKLSNLKKPMEIRKLIDYVNRLVFERGFSVFAKPVPPDLTVADGFDVVWTLNRMYNAIFIQK
ncbi:MAG TPA: ATP-binding protein [Desulfurococcales archaeon]|nr:ATP-binding protein [Desulfurococcales archaeon]